MSEISMDTLMFFLALIGGWAALTVLAWLWVYAAARRERAYRSRYQAGTRYWMKRR